MSDRAIQVENLSKRYRIGVREAGQETLAGTAAAWLKSPLNNFRRLRSLSAFADEEADDVIWALRDVSFEVKQGEVVGVIGRNGAGKSTLLKILSRITPPTQGRVVLNGRVASLLEVGTGFHPELTGRENIYLNGTILGMTKAEIDRKFDEIVDFSGVEKFIDTAVKRYSSGMRVRLAFSVAAHLEPEILLVDEVLAVGDLEFQQKCLGQMESIADEGRTVLFVSHNMSAISSLCHRGILIEQGQIKLEAKIESVIKSYNGLIANLLRTSLRERVERRGTGELRFIGVDTLNNFGHKGWISGRACCVYISYESATDQPIDSLEASIWVSDLYGKILFTCFTGYTRTKLSFLPSCGIIICQISQLLLAPGTYRLGVWGAINGRTVDYMENAAEVMVEAEDFFGTGKLPTQSKHGPFLVDHSWHWEEKEHDADS